MRVYQRGKRWGIDFSYNGKRVRRLVADTKREALLKLGMIVERIKAEETNGIPASAPRSFDEFAKEYLDFLKAEMTPENYQRESYKVNTLVKSFRDSTLDGITTIQIEQFKLSRRKKVKPASVNREIALLKRMFSRAKDWGYTDKNPASKVKLFKEPPGRIRYLTIEERRLLLEECEGMLFAIVLTALETGMRKGELQRLTWDVVDFDRRNIKVLMSKNNESRILPISDLLVPVLQKLYIARRGAYVFSKPDGSPYGNWRKAFETAKQKAGIKDFRFHDLRHTFASYLVMAGVDIRTVQVLMGHKTIRMTMRYSHLSQAHLLDAVNKVGTNLAQFETTQFDNPLSDVKSTTGT
ncbi:tyrosine-type recombinase/integrase [candidate division WOR-3 bacterium]|uniref:Tyrosine-type recombinase/integrase n=1 Tax=candidate division WOR-3 bacterium TaxID=2052148 RepID=A0A9D5K9J3_UNCW3|nr:tyrosine-type recombinase/integrase [candidate division WOR-3 bacterium]MBD3364099.1 tyrosine-type recombinase/integrase [candidate division WOR-3 bacterium]